MEQIMIAITGVIAIWLTQDRRENWRKYACLFGLAGQPFWFYSAWTAQQWGIFILAFFYTFAWIKGIQLHWLRRNTMNLNKEIDVSDIAPAKLLAALYNAACVNPFRMGIYQARSGDMTEEYANRLITGQTDTSDYCDGGPKSDGKKRYFDYVYGRCLKIEIGGKTIQPALYDRDHNEGAVQKIVDSLRQKP